MSYPLPLNRGVETDRHLQDWFFELKTNKNAFQVKDLLSQVRATPK